MWGDISLVSRVEGSRWAGLQTATFRAAEVLGQWPEFGTLAEGACADYVVLWRNPAEDKVDAADAVAGNVHAGALTFAEAGRDQR